MELRRMPRQRPPQHLRLRSSASPPREKGRETGLSQATPRLRARDDLLVCAPPMNVDGSCVNLEDDAAHPALNVNS